MTADASHGGAKGPGVDGYGVDGNGVAGVGDLRSADHGSRDGGAAVTIIEVRPNASLSVAQAWWFMAGICTVSLSIALYLTARGFWPVLPFAGLEMLALGAALWASVRQNAYRELLRFEERRLVVEYGMAGRGLRGRCELPRGMTRVFLEAGFAGDRHLVLVCGGQRLEVGRCLGPQDRATLYRRLRHLLLPGWQNTPTQPTAPPVTVHLGE